MPKLNDVKIGDTIKVTVANEPTSLAAGKTLARVLGKDPDAAKANRLQARVRAKNYNPRRRGGRLYSGRVPKQHIRKGILGETGTVRATLDVIRDLRSVERFIEVQPAA